MKNFVEFELVQTNSQGGIIRQSFNIFSIDVQEIDDTMTYITDRHGANYKVKGSYDEVMEKISQVENEIPVIITQTPTIF